MYDFDIVVNRRGTDCLQWDVADLFGVDRVEYPFWIADTDFKTVPEVAEAFIKRSQHPLFGYNIPGPDCIPSVQRWYERRHHWVFEPEQAFASIGVVTVLRASIQALTKPGDKVLVMSPVYNPFFEIVTNSGRTLVDHKLTENPDGSYSVDFEALERELGDGVKAMLFCNPHNPIGKVWKKEELQQIVDLCVKYQVILLSDEVHGDICIGGNHYTPMGTFSQVQNQLCVYTAISKTFNLAGLEASCIVIPNDDMRQKVQSELKKSWIMGPNVFACVAMEAAYNHGDQWLDELNQYLTANSEYAMTYVKENMPKLRAAPNEGTFLLWMDFRCCGMSSADVTHKLAAEFNVGLGNGSGYGEQCDGYMRFNIAKPRSLLEKGLKGIQAFYNKYTK